MRKSMILASAAAMALAGTAFADLTMDLDTDTDGATVVVFDYFQDTHGALETVSWDLSHEAFSPSWGSEVHLTMTHVDSGTSFTLGGGDDDTVDINLGWDDASGFHASAGSVTAGDLGIAIADTFGAWTIAVTESFDDAGIDGHITGSIIIGKADIPAPGALALLGLAGFAGRRRRK